MDFRARRATHRRTALAGVDEGLIPLALVVAKAGNESKHRSPSPSPCSARSRAPLLSASWCCRRWCSGLAALRVKRWMSPCDETAALEV